MQMTIEDAMKLAIEKHSAGQVAQAEAIYRRVLEAVPDHPKALHLLGIVAQQAGRYQNAMELMQRAIALSPQVAEFHSNLGQVLSALGRMDEAVAAARKAVELKPDDYRGYQNLAVVLGKQGRRDEAIAACRQTLALKPDYAEAHWNLALTLLHNGEFAEGWKEFDWRLEIPRLQLNRGFAQPRWDGADLSGKTLLLHAEGGFGDALQFVRYIPILRDRKARLILECQPALIRLFSQVEGVDQLIARGQPLPGFDYHIPLQSLPRVFGTRLESIPNTVPYLIAPPDRVAHWTQRVKADGLRNIGLVWAGSGVAPNALDARSCTLQHFAPLTQVRGVRFHSLQVGPASNQPRPAGMEVIDHAAELYDFAETAALVQNLDLIITVDTAMPHLAGALARPVWVLVSFEGDFRWLSNRTDSPWYPTLRLFQQPKIGDWESPMNQVAEALRSFLGN